MTPQQGNDALRCRHHHHRQGASQSSARRISSQLHAHILASHASLPGVGTPIVPPMPFLACTIVLPPLSHPPPLLRSVLPPSRVAYTPPQLTNRDDEDASQHIAAPAMRRRRITWPPNHPTRDMSQPPQHSTHGAMF